MTLIQSTTTTTPRVGDRATLQGIQALMTGQTPPWECAVIAVDPEAVHLRDEEDPETKNGGGFYMATEGPNGWTALGRPVLFLRLGTTDTIRVALDTIGETGSHRVWAGNLEVRREENADWMFVAAWPEEIETLRVEAEDNLDGIAEDCDMARTDADALRRVLTLLDWYMVDADQNGVIAAAAAADRAGV